MIARPRWLAVPVVFVVACQCGTPTVSQEDGGAGGAASSGGGASSSGGGTASTGGGSASTGGGSTSTGGGSAVGLDAGLTDFCAGNSPVPVSAGGSSLCAGDLGKRTFTFAFCSCQAVTANNQFRVGSIAGARDGGGSVGINGPFVGANNAVINGTLWATGNVTSSNNLTVGRDLVCGANVSLATGSVGRDLVVAGNSQASGAVSVGGTIRASAGSMVTGLNAPGGVVRGTQAISAPCDCSNPVDVAGIVNFFQSVSDNTARNVAPTALSGSTPVTLTLECGRYFFQGITSSSQVRLRTRGRVVIAVQGDVTTSNAFELIPEQGSQIDLFVSGNLSFANNASIGDPARPAATRIYVGGAQVTAANSLAIAANLYAGRAAFSANNAFELRGALFVNSVAAANTFSVSYDDAILNLDGCAAEDAGCSSCRQCANPTPACRGGSCGRCQADSDCCPPLSCDTLSGACVEGVIN